MGTSNRLCLIVNASSGSNSAEAVDALQEALTSHGFQIAMLVRFPEDPIPDFVSLKEHEIGLLVTFAGDGTINKVIADFANWSGQILVLPGGTMNLLSCRLHGTADHFEIIECVANGGARAIRPTIARCEAGFALAGLLAGPGTDWSEVREAMRRVDIAGLVSGATKAIERTIAGPMIGLASARGKGTSHYPLIEITPREWGLVANGYHAEEASEYAAQSWALLRRRFREGPHDRLGLHEEIRLQMQMNKAIDILLDGEPARISAGSAIKLENCPVDLLAIGSDG